jgi:hypothetical protein
MAGAFGILLCHAPVVWGQEAEECADGRIASITVIRHPIFGNDEGRDSASGFSRAVYDVADWVHTETKESLIRRELLFEEGDCVDRLNLTESERLIREFRFLESVTVVAEPRPDGDVDVVVTTTDDWSLRLEPRFNFGEGFAFGGVSLGETNLMGRGRTLELAYLIRDGSDDWLLRYVDPQAFATRWDLEFVAIRGTPGWIFGAALAYPFVGLVGNWAAFQNLLYSRGTPRDRSTRLASYGFLFTFEDSRYGSEAFEDSLSALVDSFPSIGDLPTTATLQPIDALRLNLVGGLRALNYIQQRGVATLRAVEDIALGASIDGLAGVAPEWFARTDAHVLAGLDLYGGTRVKGRWFSILRANGEARHDIDSGGWRDIFTAVQWTNFWVVNALSTNEITATYSAGWQTTVPFQLTLGGPEKIAGYTFDRFPGGSRLTFRIENRYNIARVGRLFDLGTVVNIDVGQMWANGAAFGVDSGLRGSVGIGFRFAAPAGSRQTYRLTLGIPLESDLKFDKLVISFSLDRLLQIEGRRPVDPQLARSRDPAILDAVRYLK